MCSLIISIIAIALVAAVALATIYYGGTAFNRGSAEAKASVAVNWWRWAKFMREVKPRAVADKRELGLRSELSAVAGFLSADKVAHATHAIELVEKMEGLLLDLKDEAVRKRTLEELEVLRAEVATFTKEARHCGEEARVAGLLESAATARRGLSGTRRDS